MDTTLTLIDLAGSVALLLWGVHMLQSGIQRAFGPQLRRFLGRAIGDRLRAFLAGLEKSRPDHLCPDPTENLILFNQLPAQGT